MSVEILNSICKLFLYESVLKIINFSSNLNTIVCSVQEVFKLFLNFIDPPHPNF